MSRKIGILLAGTVFALLIPMAAGAASGESGAGWGWLETIGRWFNLLFLLGLIFYFARKPAARFFADRRQAIRKEIHEAAELRRQAQKKLAEIEARLETLDQELEQIREDARHQAELERQRILDQAAREADKIAASARREIDGLGRAVRKDLKAYAASLSVQLAEKRIRRDLTDEAEDRVVEAFFADLSAKGGR